MNHIANPSQPTWRRWLYLSLMLFTLSWSLSQSSAAAALPLPLAILPPSENEYALSPIWQPIIHQWTEEIQVISNLYGIDCDLIAAVINAESNGVPDLVSRAGAVGLMGVLPAGPGMEWRPSTEALKDPVINLNWGGAILADIIQQAGGDIAAALAAYSGGWDNATRRVPLEYAARVLNEYGRAVAARSGIAPDIASRWTVAVRIDRGNIANETLVLNQKPVSGILTFGEHIVYQSVGADGQNFYVRGYAIPLVLVVPQEIPYASYSDNLILDPHLIARVGLSNGKVNVQNPRVVLACLPSLSRLRGQLSTRWYAPSSCPSWHR